MPRQKSSISIFILSIVLMASGCATPRDQKADTAQALQAPPAPAPTQTEIARLIEAERQLAEKQRHCQEEKRRLELALKENQKRNDDVQKKLDALLAIDREIRSRGKTR